MSAAAGEMLASRVGAAPKFMPLLAISALLHGLCGALLLAASAFSVQPLWQPPPLTVELIALPAPAPPPRSAVLLPARPAARASSFAAEPAQPVQQSLADILGEFESARADVAEVLRERPQPSRAAPPPATPTLSQSIEVWRREVAAQVGSRWKLAANLRRLSAAVEVQLSAAGEVTAVRVLRSSGSPVFDASAERAVLSASPLPTHPETGGIWTFEMRPEELL